MLSNQFYLFSYFRCHKQNAMKKLFAVILAVLTIGANAQTTQGISPEYISELCVVSYIHTDSLGFHWTLVHEKASSPDVVFYTFETASIANPTWVQRAFHDYQQASAFVLDTIPFDTASYFRLATYDAAQNLIYTSTGKPMFITSVQESVTHTALTFSSYQGFTPPYYIIYRGNSPLTLAPYDSISGGPGAVQNYFDPEADSYSHYYQIGAVRPTTCDGNNASGYAALSAIALSDIVLAGTVGVNEQQALNAITLFPNPTQNTLNINLNKTSNSNVSVQVLNPMGQVVKTQAFDKAAGQKLTLDIAALPTGIYFVQVQAFDGVKAFKVYKN